MHTLGFTCCIHSVELMQQVGHWALMTYYYSMRMQEFVLKWVIGATSTSTMLSPSPSMLTIRTMSQILPTWSLPGVQNLP